MKPRDIRVPFAEFPWRNLTFRKSRKGWGIVHAQVLLGGKWCDVEFGMVLEGLELLAALPEHRLARLLATLALFPARNRFLPGQEKGKPRGRNTATRWMAWNTARWLAPKLLEWAEDESERNRGPYRQVLKQLKHRGIRNPDCKAVVAFLIERNWTNSYRSWPGVSPLKSPAKFFKTLATRPFKPAPSYYPSRIADLISGPSTELANMSALVKAIMVDGAWVVLGAPMKITVLPGF